MLRKLAVLAGGALLAVTVLAGCDDGKGDAAPEGTGQEEPTTAQTEPKEVVEEVIVEESPEDLGLKIHMDPEEIARLDAEEADVELVNPGGLAAVRVKAYPNELSVWIGIPNSAGDAQEY